MEHENEILLELQRHSMQLERIISDIESEKEVRRRITMDMEKRLRDLELWKSEIHGRIVVTVSIASVIVTAAVAIIIKLIK